MIVGFAPTVFSAVIVNCSVRESPLIFVLVGDVPHPPDSAILPLVWDTPVTWRPTRRLVPPEMAAEFTR